MPQGLRLYPQIGTGMTVETPFSSPAARQGAVSFLVQPGIPEPQAHGDQSRSYLRAAASVSFDRLGCVWLIAILFALLGFMVMLMWVMSIAGHHADEPCDQPAASMLNALIVIFFANFCQWEVENCLLCYRHDHDSSQEEPCRVKAYRVLSFGALLLWPIACGIALQRVQTCPGEVVHALWCMLGYMVFFITLGFLLPALHVGVTLMLLRVGWVQFPRGPRHVGLPVNIVELLPGLEYSAKLGEEIGITQCSICIEDFEDAQPVSKTNCSPAAHLFHTECLRRWTRNARTCPLCRESLLRDLEVSAVDVELRHVVAPLQVVPLAVPVELAQP